MPAQPLGQARRDPCGTFETRQDVMNGNEVLRIVDAIHRDKNIDKEIVFEGIEQAILSAAQKHYGEESDARDCRSTATVRPAVGRTGRPGSIRGRNGDLLGRIAAQTAKQVMIQKIREAERDALFDEYAGMRGQIVTGTVTRVEGGTATVNLGKVEGIAAARASRFPANRTASASGSGPSSSKSARRAAA